MASDPCDVVVVDLGARGLRARRYEVPGPVDAQALDGRSASADHSASDDVAGPDAGAAPTPIGSVDAPKARPGSVTVEDLVTAVTPLVRVPERDLPAVVVWSIAGGSDLDPYALLSHADVLAAGPTGTSDARPAGQRQVRHVVVDAAVATLVGALGEVALGVVLDMGAGVHALATDFDQVWHRVDGWGPLLGGRGSASWLGSQGLAAGLRHRDGVPGGSAALLAAGRRAFGDEERWPALLTEHDAEAMLADFAPVVGETALTDPTAEGICRLAGEHLADTICAGSARLSPLSSAPITATGGLLLIDAVKVAFASALGRRCRFLVPALGDSLAGARHLAAHLAVGGRLPHRPPYVVLQGRSALPSS